MVLLRTYSRNSLLLSTDSVGILKCKVLEILPKFVLKIRKKFPAYKMLFTDIY